MLNYLSIGKTLLYLQEIEEAGDQETDGGDPL
jgi:hypothetical protein